MYTGQILSYSVCPLWNIKVEWVTEITAVDEPTYFIDEQIFGPYSFWHHEHWFTSVSDGVLMEDIIYYKVPFSVFGKLLHHFKIRKDLEQIFLIEKDFRKSVWTLS
ncbi:MAG: SRPBCC family protein [Parachlamydiaceae bacterium]|nr:MAG: SRPBCC family protein [Parachlamydiaceae bacterium]